MTEVLVVVGQRQTTAKIQSPTSNDLVCWVGLYSVRLDFPKQCQKADAVLR